MQSPQIVFHQMDPSPALEARIRERIARLSRLAPDVTSCHVAVEEPHRHGRKGHLFDIRIRLHVPGREIVVNRGGSQDHAHEDAYVVVREAFDAVERNLEDFVRRRDHRTRSHQKPA